MQWRKPSGTDSQVEGPMEADHVRGRVVSYLHGFALRCPLTGLLNSCEQSDPTDDAERSDSSNLSSGITKFAEYGKSAGLLRGRIWGDLVEPRFR